MEKRIVPSEALEISGGDVKVFLANERPLHKFVLVVTRKPKQTDADVFPVPNGSKAGRISNTLDVVDLGKNQFSQTPG